ncbi:MAG: hypothetical protein K2F96_01405 [Muribaculaceae bacterium]|nr:hypothetical protein [Muribaculaceae bacterium]
MRKMKNLLALTITSLTLYACSTAHRDNGWYPVDNSNNIEGKAIVTTNDFAKVSLDTVTDPEIAFIQGVLKQDRISDWADATERRIGKRIGFVYKDSVIMAPTVNCRIESGSFSINNSDKRLILEIYNSLDCDKIEPPYVMPQKSYATAEGMIMRIVSPDPVKTQVDSLIVEFTNSRDAELTTGEWYRIDTKSDEGNWIQAPYSKKYLDLLTKGTEVCFNGIGYSLKPGGSFRMTVKPWLYDLSDKSTTYRLVKTFSYPPYPIHKSDTAYVEFQIR